MVLAYLCPEHGYHTECDVSGEHNDSKCTVGQRVCPEDVDVPVTGITGRTRRMIDGSMDGSIEWRIKCGYSRDYVYVLAHDHHDAIETALDEYGPDTRITDVEPADRRYRQ